MKVAPTTFTSIQLDGALKANPDIAPVLLKLLEAAGSDPTKLGSLVDKVLIEIHSALPPARRSARELIDQFKFETLQTPHGPGYRFLQPKGMALAEIASAINRTSQRLLKRATLVRGELFKDAEMKAVPEADMVHGCVPFIRDSNNLSAFPQLLLLRNIGRTTTNRAVVAICAGFQRLKFGVPQCEADIGTENDPGDILQGRVTRTARNLMIGCDRDGLVDSHYTDESPMKNVFVAASL